MADISDENNRASPGSGDNVFLRRGGEYVPLRDASGYDYTSRSPSLAPKDNPYTRQVWSEDPSYSSGGAAFDVNNLAYIHAYLRQRGMPVGNAMTPRLTEDMGYLHNPAKKTFHGRALDSGASSRAYSVDGGMGLQEENLGRALAPPGGAPDVSDELNRAYPMPMPGEAEYDYQQQHEADLLAGGYDRSHEAEYDFHAEYARELLRRRRVFGSTVVGRSPSIPGYDMPPVSWRTRANPQADLTHRRDLRGMTGGGYGQTDDPYFKPTTAPWTNALGVTPQPKAPQPGPGMSADPRMLMLMMQRGGGQ